MTSTVALASNGLDPRTPKVLNDRTVLMKPVYGRMPVVWSQLQPVAGQPINWLRVDELKAANDAAGIISILVLANWPNWVKPGVNLTPEYVNTLCVPAVMRYGTSVIYEMGNEPQCRQLGSYPYQIWGEGKGSMGLAHDYATTALPAIAFMKRANPAIKIIGPSFAGNSFFAELTELKALGVLDQFFAVTFHDYFPTIANAADKHFLTSPSPFLTQTGYAQDDRHLQEGSLIWAKHIRSVLPTARLWCTEFGMQSPDQVRAALIGYKLAGVEVLHVEALASDETVPSDGSCLSGWKANVMVTELQILLDLLGVMRQ